MDLLDEETGNYYGNSRRIQQKLFPRESPRPASAGFFGLRLEYALPTQWRAIWPFTLTVVLISNSILIPPTKKCPEALASGRKNYVVPPEFRAERGTRCLGNGRARF